MLGPILQHDDLRELARMGPRCTLARLEAWAKRCGIRYQYDGKGGIWTTLDALNQALGVASAANDSEAYDPDRFG